MKYLVITDDGKIFPFDPEDWRWVVSQKDVEARKYEPRYEQKVEGDKVRVRFTQRMPPLVKIR